VSKASLAYLSELALELASAALDRSPAAAPIPGRPYLNYESLLAGSNQPVLIAKTGDGRIVIANPAAARLLRIPGATLVGMTLTALFDAATTSALTDDGASLIEVQPAHRAEPLRARASKVKTGGQSYLIVRLQPLDNESVTHLNGHATSSVIEAIDQAGVALLVTDDELRVQFANRSFEEMSGVASGAASGQHAIRWLRLTQADMSRLRDQRVEQRAAINFDITFQPENAASRRIEAEAVSVPDGADSLWGFILREPPRAH
jgi:PAS domain-containing protein